MSTFTNTTKNTSTTTNTTKNTFTLEYLMTEAEDYLVTQAEDYLITNQSSTWSSLAKS